MGGDEDRLGPRGDPAGGRTDLQRDDRDAIRGERVGGTRLAGALLGLRASRCWSVHPVGRGYLAALAVVLAALAYAVAREPRLADHGADAAARRRDGLGRSPPSSVTAPFGLARLPHAVPGWKELSSLAVLGLVGTGVAYVILFALLQSAGPSRTILITYLIPGIAVLYGVLLLGEPLRAAALGGLAMILAGVALAGRKGARETAADASAATAAERR